MIRLSDINVIFGKGTALETHALKNVNLEVPTGQFLTIIGSNGAGKSTSLNVVAGTAPVESGKIEIDHNDITSLRTHQRAKLISRVFQDPKMGTCEELTIMENIAIARARTNTRGFKMAIDDELRTFSHNFLGNLGLGLESRLGDKVGLLSGGQRQALSLFMASMSDTRVLLLDEHTAALDPKTAEFVMDLSRKVVAEKKLTTIMVTHSMQQALENGDRTVMFHGGKIIFDVSGAERENMTVVDLLELFRRDTGEILSEDSLLLD